MRYTKRAGHILFKTSKRGLMKDFIFIGPPGSGKGTVSKKLLLEGYHQISTGDLLRAEISKQSPLGLKIKDIIGKGNLVSDDIALELIKQEFSPNKTFIFDGFPRTVGQAQLLSPLLKGRDTAIVYFKIDDALLLERIVHRRSCAKCGAIYNLKNLPPKQENVCDHCHHSPLTHRKDDEEGILKTRLEVYHQSTAPLLDHYKDSLITIDATLDSEAIIKILKSL